MKIKKAIIPAAGLGTRLSPVTNSIPKELLPIGNRPMLHYCIEEAMAVNIEEILIILNQKKRALIEEYFRHFFPSFTISIFYQEEALGLVDAILRARNAVGEEPFFLLLPDNVYFGKIPSTRKLLACYQEYKQSVLGLIEITKQVAPLYGHSGKVECQKLMDSFYHIKKLYDKRPGTFRLDDEKKAIRSCGRYILTAEFWYEVEQQSRNQGNEFDDVPILQSMVAKGKIKGVLLRDKLFDCGHWNGYWAANQFWMKQEGLWN